MEDVPEEEEEGELEGWSGRGFLGSVKTQVEEKQVCSSAAHPVVVGTVGGGEATRSGFSTHGGCWSDASSHRHLVLNQQQETSSPLK